MLCGYTASWGDASWANGSHAFQLRLCQVGHLAFRGGQHVYGPVVIEGEKEHRGATAETEAQGSGSFFPSRKEGGNEDRRAKKM